MSLYGDLPPPSSNKDAIQTGNSSLGDQKTDTSLVPLNSDSVTLSTPAGKPILAAPHFLPSAVIRRPNPSSTGSKITSFKKPPVFKPTITLNSAPLPPQQAISTTVTQPIQSSNFETVPTHSSRSLRSTGPQPLTDEYDPSRPNEFSEMQKLWNQARIAERIKARQSRQRPSSRSRSRDRYRYSSSRSRSSSPRNRRRYDSRSRSRSPYKAPSGRYSAIPPPPSLNITTPAQEESKPVVSPPPRSTSTSFPSTGEEAYLRRLQLSQPKPAVTAVSQRPPETPSQGPPTFSPVLLLMNMVGRDDADDQLKDEVSMECSKFGPVKQCLIYIAPPYVSDKHAVRIFVEFDSNSSALKAQSALHGRFFAGRSIEAVLFDPDRFRKYDLASRPDELAKGF